MTIIEIKNLTHKFSLGKSEVVAIRGVNLQVSRGEFVSLVGPSGSGKSTLLSLIGGLCRPDRGELIVNGHSLIPMDENRLAIFRRKHIGFIFQSFNLFQISLLWRTLLYLYCSAVLRRESEPTRPRRCLRWWASLTDLTTSRRN